MKRWLPATVLIGSFLVGGPGPLAAGEAAPLASEAITGIIHASQTGRATLDRGDDDGNPFASALVELLGRPSLTMTDLMDQIVSLTRKKSGGYQVPDVSGVGGAGGAKDWTIKPARPGSKSVALIVTYSQYTSSSVQDLPGAERDRVRLSQAFRSAGFAVETVANPTTSQLNRLVTRLAAASRHSDVAVIYVTGHGFEDQGQVYLAPSNYSFNRRTSPLAGGALEVADLGKSLKAQQANLVFFGGCRTRRLAPSP